MKIIAIDNFDRETVSDVLIAENVKEYWADQLTKMLNKNFGGPAANKFFVSKPDDYKLYEWQP